MFWLVLVMLAAVVALPLDARVRKIDYGERSKFEEERAEFDIERPQMNTTLNNSRLHLVEWHSNFSRLGQQRADLRGGTFNGNVMEMNVQETKLKNTKLSGNNRRMARLRNWNYLKENVVAGKFSGSEITSPVGRKMQQMVDEVSLQEINRFMFARNQTDEGILATRAGEGELTEMPLQFREQAITVDDDIDDGDPGVLFRQPVLKQDQDVDAELEAE